MAMYATVNANSNYRDLCTGGFECQAENVLLSIRKRQLSPARRCLEWPAKCGWGLTPTPPRGFSKTGQEAWKSVARHATVSGVSHRPNEACHSQEDQGAQRCEGTEGVKSKEVTSRGLVRYEREHGKPQQQKDHS